MHPGDKSRAWYPILAVGLSMVGFISIKTGRDTVFFSQGGLRQLPLVYMLIALVSVPAAMMHLEAMRRWGARRARIGVLVLTVALFLGFVPFADLQHKAAMMAMFALVPAVFAAVFAAAWLLAADLLEGMDETTAGWVYSRIGAASMAGGMAGGLLAKGLATIGTPRLLLATGSLMVALAAVIIWRAHREYPAGTSASRMRHQSEAGSKLKPSPAFFSAVETVVPLLKSRYLVALLGISAFSAVAALYIDFQFYAVATLTGHRGAQFFGSYYTILNLAGLGLQLLAAPWIQSRFGVGGALMVMPLVLLGGAGGIALLSTTVVNRSILKVTEGGLKASIHRSIWEQVFLPLGERARDMGKVLVDGLFARLSEGVAALALYVWMARLPALDQDVNLAWISGAILVAVLMWIVLTRYLAQLRCCPADDVDPVIRIPDS